MGKPMGGKARNVFLVSDRNFPNVFLSLSLNPLAGASRASGEEPDHLGRIFGSGGGNG